MSNWIYLLFLANALVCHYYMFYICNFYLKGNGREMLKRQRTIKNSTMLIQTNKNTTHHFSSVMLNNTCYSTLLYPEYTHSSKCFPHLYFS